jgi:hypothetical protein
MSRGGRGQWERFTPGASNKEGRETVPVANLKTRIKQTKSQSAFHVHHVLVLLNNVSDKILLPRRLSAPTLAFLTALLLWVGEGSGSLGLT